ncbi:hypothetical protein J4N45_10270 [Vibrio sp. SCSIO 43140]|uniref:hypothetical protein n=1 Tax=Vibrio sp. SCSIO 43140 TaxID=2819100 RepID=UPI00207638DA|nr:hypothetical protein [Vibrio sp. SCSIO 43140]USD58914.1 hypothetical protein J4N45_10270 [Vibrio sp. SCSIO 43140]
MNRWMIGVLFFLCVHGYASEYSGEASTVTSKERTSPLLIAQLSDEATRNAIKKAQLRSAIGKASLHEEDIVMSKVYWPLMVDIIDKNVDSQPCKEGLICTKVSVVVMLDEATFVEQMQELWMSNQIEVNVDRFHKHPSHVFVSQLKVLDLRIAQLEQLGESPQTLNRLRVKKTYLRDLVNQSKQLRLAYEINKHYTNMGIFGEPLLMERVSAKALNVTLDVRGFGDGRFSDKMEQLLVDMGYSVTAFYRAVQQGTVKEGLTVGLGFGEGPVLKLGQFCVTFDNDAQAESLKPVLSGQSTLTIPLLGTYHHVRVGDIRVKDEMVWPKQSSNTLCVWDKFEYQYDIEVDETLLAFYAQDRMEGLPLRLIFEMGDALDGREVAKQTVLIPQPEGELGLGVKLPLLEIDSNRYQHYVVVGCDEATFSCRTSNSWY